MRFVPSNVAQISVKIHSRSSVSKSDSHHWPFLREEAIPLATSGIFPFITKSSPFSSNSLYHLLNRYFDCVDVCKVRPLWTEVRQQGKFAYGHEDYGTVSILHVFSPTDVDFSLFQTSDRYACVDLSNMVPDLPHFDSS